MKRVIQELGGYTMLTSRVTKKGQVTIPAQLRDALGLNPGDEVEFMRENKNRIVVIRRKKNVEESFGIVKVHLKVTLKDIEEAIEKGATDGIV